MDEAKFVYECILTVPTFEGCRRADRFLLLKRFLYNYIGVENERKSNDMHCIPSKGGRINKSPSSPSSKGARWMTSSTSSPSSSIKGVGVQKKTGLQTSSRDRVPAT